MRLKGVGRLITVSLALLLAACSIGRDDLIGDFQIDYGYAVETLRLSPDGQYTQLVRLKDESTWTTHSGTWQFRDEPRPQVSLQDSLQVDNGSGKLREGWQQPIKGMRDLPVKWEWSLPVKKNLRTISLVLDASRKLMMTQLPSPTPSEHKPNIIHLPPTNDVEVK